MELMGERLRSLRKSKGYTQEDLAELAGIGRPNLAKYETGKSLPSVDILIKLADALDVSTDYLLGRARLDSDHNKGFAAAAHVEGPITPEVESRIEAIIQEKMDAYIKKMEQK